jgi:hypothetical protein
MRLCGNKFSYFTSRPCLDFHRVKGYTAISEFSMESNSLYNFKKLSHKPAHEFTMKNHQEPEFCHPNSRSFSRSEIVAFRPNNPALNHTIESLIQLETMPRLSVIFLPARSPCRTSLGDRGGQRLFSITQPRSSSLPPTDCEPP